MICSWDLRYNRTMRHVKRLVVAFSGTLWEVDNENYARCAICAEWFFKYRLYGSYCGQCWKHYQRWRWEELAREKANGYRIVVDASVQTFREKYMSGLLAPMVPWTWPGETEVPPGALT